MKYFIGADQGGSKTDVLISDENGNIIDRQTGYGYCSFLKELHDKSEFVVKYIEQQVTILENILNKNSIDICDVCVLTACMATVNDNNKRDYEEEIRKKIPIQNITVCNDIYSAWRAGTVDKPSGVLSVGTGTNIMFFNDDGTTIGMEENLKYRAAKELGYRAFLHACYSGLNIFEPTLLSEKVCEFSQTSTIEEAFKKIEYGKDLNILLYQDFVPYIYDAVLQKDRVAEDFINQVGIGFADCILDGIKYLGWETREIAFVLNGGSFKGKGYVLDKVIKNYLKSHPNIKLFQSKYEPVYGALMMSFEIHNNGVFPHISDEDALKFNLQRVLSVN